MHHISDSRSFVAMMRLCFPPLLRKVHFSRKAGKSCVRASKSMQSGTVAGLRSDKPFGCHSMIITYGASRTTFAGLSTGVIFVSLLSSDLPEKDRRWCAGKHTCEETTQSSTTSSSGIVGWPLLISRTFGQKPPSASVPLHVNTTFLLQKPSLSGYPASPG